MLVHFDWSRRLTSPAHQWKVAVVVALATQGGCQPQVPWSGPEGGTKRIAVVPFHADSASRAPIGAQVAESLTARLSGVQGLEARLDREGGATGADFVVRGELEGREGRLVIATRLQPATGDGVLWTATFWRDDAIDSNLIHELATGLAEAIYGQLARAAIAAKGGPK